MLVFVGYTDKVWELHHLFLEETQGSFSEVMEECSFTLYIEQYETF